jgi:hypothetical protein
MSANAEMNRLSINMKNVTITVDDENGMLEREENKEEEASTPPFLREIQEA